MGGYAFLKPLHRDAEDPIVVIVDNTKYHHSRETRRFIEHQKSQAPLVYLRPHSPQRNPDERAWNNAKREIGKRTILNNIMLERAVLGVMHLLPNLHSIPKREMKGLVRNFLQFPGTRYILETMQ